MSARARLAVIAALLLLVPFAALSATVVMTGTGPGGLDVDAEVAAWLHDIVVDRPWLGRTLEVIGWITHPTVLRVLALIAAVLLWRRNQRRAAGWLVLTMTVGGLLGAGLKLVFSRSRPEWPDAITVIDGYSFPSGHALNSMLATACAIVLLHPALGPAGRRLLLWTTALFVLVVGIDRLALGVHYLTDVLAGWTLALAVVFATLAALGVPPAVRLPPSRRDLTTSTPDRR